MGREYRPLFAWYGDMDLVPHLWEAVKTGPIDVVVEFHPPMTAAAEGGRKKLAAKIESLIRSSQARALAGVDIDPATLTSTPLGGGHVEIAEAAA